GRRSGGRAINGSARAQPPSIPVLLPSRGRSGPPPVVPPSTAEVLAEPAHRQGPGPFARPSVRALAAVLLAEEAVAGAVERVGLERIAERLHGAVGRRYGRVDPGVVAAVKPEHRRPDAGQLGGFG